MPRIDGYPTSIGSKTLGTVVKFGPASYAAGGFEAEAAEFGLGAIDIAGSMNGQAGAYFTATRMITPEEDKSPRTSVWVQVFLASTGAEVADATNLSAITFRLWAIG